MPSNLAELYRLYEDEELMSEAFLGTPLATVLASYGFPNGTTDMSLTFEDDFDDIALTIGGQAVAGGKKWFTKGTYETLFTGKISEFGVDSPDMYTQHAPSILGMGYRKVPGVARWVSQIETYHVGTNLDDEPDAYFVQQFGYTEFRMKPADPTGSNSILWPAGWFNSINRRGGTPGNLFTSAIEDDVIEMYNTDENVSATDTGTHVSLHKHEPRKLVGPGTWGRDVHAGAFTNMASNAIWGTDENFRFWNDFHTFGRLWTPTMLHWFFDGLELCRAPMHEELAGKQYVLVDHAVAQELSGGSTVDTTYITEVDYVRVWQGKDWQTTPASNQLDAVALTGGGTANAKTITTVQAMASYTGATGRVIVASFATANTGATTLNANTLGAKNVYKRSVSSTIPESGSLVALTGGEIGANEWKAFTFDEALDSGAGAWVLYNSRYSMQHPEPFAPAAFNPGPATVDIEALEAGLVEKHGIDPLLFPAAHPARTPKITASFTPPQMAPNRTFRVVEGLTAGADLGTVAVLNTPTDQIRYSQVGATTHYVTNPATGLIEVASGHTTALGVEEFQVYAWPVPPRPIIPGSNCTRVFADIRADVEFDLSYFDDLVTWLDAQDAGSLSLNGSAVLSWADKSPLGQIWQQDIVADQPTHSATGLNSLPAVSSLAGSTDRLLAFTTIVQEPPVSTSRVSNIVVRPAGAMSISLHNVTRITAAFTPTDAHMGLFTWSPAGVTFWVNGAEIGMDAAASQAGITTSGFAFHVMDVVALPATSVARLYDLGRLLNVASGSQSINGAVGEFALLLGHTLTQGEIDKIFGYAAHRWNLTGLLAAGHPYKSVAPRMWE